MIVVDSKTDLNLSIPGGQPAAAVLASHPIGYGSPQIPSFALSLVKTLARPVVVFAPHPIDGDPALDFSDIHFNDPNLILICQKTKALYSTAEGSSERLEFIKAYINKTRPEIIVAFLGSLLPPAASLSYKPKAVIAYLLEMSSLGSREVLAFRGTENLKRASGFIDLFIYPELNRARLDIENLGLSISSTEVEILHNSRFWDDILTAIPPDSREAAFFYGGGLRKIQNFGSWFLTREIQRFPINIYGWLYDFDPSGLIMTKLEEDSSRLRYHGVKPSDVNYFNILSRHAWSLVLWAPVQENLKYASPNKLYDALACGVPFISGPTPLAAELAEKYHCGLIMPDWKLETFVKTLERAQDIFGSAEYGLLAEGCARAMREECDWDLQFDRKIRPRLRAWLERRGGA